MINILRNKEIRILLALLIGISAAGIILASIISPMAGFITFIVSFLIIGLSILFTLKRYKEIEKLSGYLRNISNGNYSMDIRDNEEGELSILKNEIYKVTLMLSKQGEFLKRDKERLADAISDISHQLKTPLTSMMVMIDLLREENLEIEKEWSLLKI